ncbi:hypothetical protein SGFS_001830 [Streptomyces graminofaciens]|uniref:Uncharacterized protein n=1 Tax=Streptomyces graminofaciens TaxID=68212 RepID=A0ABN5V830_9ACTN|nr:hypothetical protein SGFS_001830 [Streptomyces graminofaciens]
MSRCGGFLGAFDKVTVVEAGAGPDEGDEVGCGTARQRAWADSTSVNTIARATAGLPRPW